MESHTRLNEKYMPVWYIVFQGLKVRFIKNARQGTSSVISYCFTSAFTSNRYHFYNFLEPYSIFSENKILIKNFPLLTYSPNPPTLLTTKIH